MATYILLILFILFTAITTISVGFPTIITQEDELDPENLTLKEKQDLFKTTLASSANFKCAPRPRSFHAADLFEEGKSASLVIYPYNYVLNRCDSQSGCCSDPRQVCEEFKTQKVILMFQFIDKITNERQFKAKIVSNHSECKCARRKLEGIPEVLESLHGGANEAKPILFMYYSFIAIIIYIYI